MFGVPWKWIIGLIVNIRVCTCTSSMNSLLLIHAISRHGDRTPVDTYPTDPYINETFAPFGWGQLTKFGRIHQYELGKFLRKKYIKFLDDWYSPNVVTVQTTDSDRTKMSAQLQMSGLFPPNKDQIWNKNLKWQPVSINYEPLDEDKLLLVRIPCPRYYELKDELQKQKSVDNHSSLYDYLSQKTGMHVTSPDDIQSLYSTFKAEEEFGLKLPDWSRKVYPHPMYKIAANSFVLNAYNREMQRLKSGLLLNKILEDSYRRINHLDQRKMYLYVGHDSTIANLLMALEVWESQVPDYNTLIILELHKIRNNFKMKVSFKNNTGLYHLKLPSCDLFCPLRKFAALTKNVTMKHSYEECFNTKWRQKMKESGSP